MNRTLAVVMTALAVNPLLAGMPNPAGADGRQDHRVDGGRGCKGAEMTNPPDVGQTLEHCMGNITGAGAAMADDMRGAAMMLGAAEMMLASASNAVHKRAAHLTQAPTRLDTGDETAGR